MVPDQAQGERRHHQRFQLGLPVNVHIDGLHEPVTVQMIDIGARGVRFRSSAERARPVNEIQIDVDQGAAFGFVISDQHICVANGRVLRVSGRDGPGGGGAAAGGATGDEWELVLSVERANAAFHSFLASLAPSSVA
jgi:hypothetical protein